VAAAQAAAQNVALELARRQAQLAASLAAARAAAVARGLPLPPAITATGGATSGVGVGVGVGAAGAAAGKPSLASVQAMLAAAKNAKRILASKSGFAALSKQAVVVPGALVGAAPGGRFQPVATTLANRASLRKRFNPYLSSDTGAADHDGTSDLLAQTAPGTAQGSSAGGAGGNKGGDDKSDVVVASAGYDPRMSSSTKKRNRASAAFKFVEPGSIAKQAEAKRDRDSRRAALAMARAVGSRHQPRTHAELEAASSSAAAAAAAGGNSNLVALGRRADALPDLPDTTTPGVEWWDVEFLPAAVRKAHEAAAKVQEAPPVSSYTQVKATHCVTLRAGLVELPVPVQSVNSDLAPLTKAAPLMLTKKEQKKWRRAKRAEKIKETRDKVARRLIEPPPPKIKIKNMMRVMAQQAVMDPTRLEAHVRAETAKRKKAHEMRNMARKLTPAERKAKLKRKLTATSTDVGVDVALFRVKDLSHKQHQYQVDVNVQQLYLTGCVLHCKELEVYMVVVEGGFRAIKKFKRLMTARINWSARQGDKDSDSSDSDSDDEGAQKKNDNSCDLVWTVRGVAVLGGVRVLFHTLSLSSQPMFRLPTSCLCCGAVWGTVLLARPGCEAKGVFTV